MTIRTEQARGTQLGIVALLVLAGPLGWLALAALYSGLAGGRETLTVQLPWTERTKVAYDELVHRRDAAVIVAGVLSAATGTLFLWLRHAPGTFAGHTMLLVLSVLAGICVVGAVAAVAETRKATVQVRLDASRRWVTLKGVHPNFAEAVEASRRGKHTPLP